MPEQPQWSERTLDMPPQDPWASAQPQAHPHAYPPANPGPFSAGRARVNPHPHAEPNTFHEPTGTGWPGAEVPAPHHTMRDLRRGGEWTSAAVLFAFVCWGIWAISSSGSVLTAITVLVLSLGVAAGLFALSRLVGRVVLEKQFHRVRRTARGSHLVASLFLIGVGLAFLQQTQWVMDAYRWVLSHT